MTNIAERPVHVQATSCGGNKHTTFGDVFPSSFPSGKTPQNGQESQTLDKYCTTRQNPSRSEAIPTGVISSKTLAATAKKSAAAKYISGPLALSLVNLRSPLEDSYWNTWRCGDIRQQVAGVIRTTRRCGNRWCIACNRIRTAKAINKYGPVIDGWDRYFVTLTLPTVSAEELLPTLHGDSTDPSAIDLRIKAAADSVRTVRRHMKKEGKVFLAVRKLECTARPDGRYHPHFHFIVDGKEAAERLVAEWLRRHPLASPGAQDILKADEGSYVELFKYATKILSDGKTPVKPERLDVIYRSLRNRRTWQPIGFKVPGEDGSEEVLRPEAGNAWKRVEEAIDWTWKQEVGDWVDMATGEQLADHDPSESLIALSERLKEEGERIEREQKEADTPCPEGEPEERSLLRIAKVQESTRARKRREGKSLSALRTNHIQTNGEEHEASYQRTFDGT